MSNTKPTYKEIAQSFSLWGEYVDVDGNDTEESFNANSWEERVEIMIQCFGPEGQGAEVQGN